MTVTWKTPAASTTVKNDYYITEAAKSFTLTVTRSELTCVNFAFDVWIEGQPYDPTEQNHLFIDFATSSFSTPGATDYEFLLKINVETSDYDTFTDLERKLLVQVWDTEGGGSQAFTIGETMIVRFLDRCSDATFAPGWVSQWDLVRSQGEEQYDGVFNSFDITAPLITGGYSCPICYSIQRTPSCWDTSSNEWEDRLDINYGTPDNWSWDFDINDNCWQNKENPMTMYAWLLTHKQVTQDRSECISRAVDETTDVFLLQIFKSKNCVFDNQPSNPDEFTYYMGSNNDEILIFFQLKVASSDASCEISYTLQVGGQDYVKANFLTYIKDFNENTGIITLDSKDYANHDGDVYDFVITAYAGLRTQTHSFIVRYVDPCRISTLDGKPTCANQVMELWESQTFAFTKPTLEKETSNNDACPILCKMLLTYLSDAVEVTKEVGSEPYGIQGLGYDLNIDGYLDLNDESYFLKTQTKFYIKCTLQNMEKTVDVAAKTSAAFTIEVKNPCLIEYGADPFENQSIDALTVWVTGVADTSVFTEFVDNVSLNYGTRSGLQELCGKKTYKLVKKVGTDYVDLTGGIASALTLDETSAPTFTISLQTDSVADSTDGNPVDYWLEVSFETYPTVKEHFQVQVTVWCNVLSFTSAAVAPVDYNVYTPQITIAYNEFVQEPACGHELAENWAVLRQIVDGAVINEWPFPTHGLTIIPAGRQITLYSEDPADVGDFVIRVFSEVKPGEPETNVGAPQNVRGILDIPLTIQNGCLNDVVTMTDDTRTNFDQKAYTNYINRAWSDVTVSLAFWTQSVAGCPLEIKMEITSSVERQWNGSALSNVVTSDEQTGIVTFREQTVMGETGAYFHLGTPSDSYYVYDLEVWTVSLIKESVRSTETQFKDPVVFTVTLKDICWDAVLTAPVISNDSLDIYSDGKIINFQALIAEYVRDEDVCGGITHELVLVNGPTTGLAGQPDFVSRWPLSCTGSDCALTGVTDTFPNLMWEGIFNVQIKGTLGTFVASGGTRGTNKQGLYLSKTTDFTITGIDSCRTTTIQVPGIRDMSTSVNAGWQISQSGSLIEVIGYDEQSFGTFVDTSTNTYGVGCGPKSQTMIWTNLKLVSSHFVFMQQKDDGTYFIRLQTSNPDYAGTYELGVRSQLINYPWIEVTDWFKVTIDPCIPLIRQAPAMADQVYSIGENSLLLGYSFSQFPCEYAATYKVEQRENWFKQTLSEAPYFVFQDDDFPSLKVISTEPDDAGEYTLVITQMLYDKEQTSTSFEFNLTVIAPKEDWTVPNNTAPFFTREPADQYIMWGERLYYKLGELFDLQNDEVFIDVNCNADFIHFNYDGNVIYIDKNATPSFDLNKVYSCKIDVWDDNKLFPKAGQDTWTVFIEIGSKPQDFSDKTKGDYIEDIDLSSFKNYVFNRSEPTFYIYSLRRDGLLTLTISPPIQVVNISEFNKTVAVRFVSQNKTDEKKSDSSRRLKTQRFKTENGFEELQIKPIIELYIKPSHSERVDLNFTWKVVSMQTNLIQFKLDFETPPDVSAKTEPDMLYVTIWGSEFFKSKEGYKIKAGTTRSVPVTQQVFNERLKYIDRNALILDVVIKIVILLSLFIQSLLGKSRQSIWAFVDVLQTLLYIPLLSVGVPAEAAQLCQRLFDTARMMPLPINALIQQHFKFQDKPYNMLFYDAGYNTTFIWPSLSGILVLFAIWLVFQCLLILLDKKLNAKSVNPKQFQRAGMNCLGRLLLMTYLEMMICMSLNFTTMIGMGAREAISSILTCVIAIVLFLFTVFIFLLVVASLVFPHDNQKVPEFQIERDKKYIKKHRSEQFYEHNQRETMERTPLFWMVQWLNFYDLFDGMKNQVEHHYLMVSVWLLLFVTRRIVFVILIFALPHWPVGQIFTLFFFSGLVMAYLWKLKTFEDKFVRGQMLFNEWCIFFVMANLLLVSDFVDIVSKDFVFGYTLIALILLCVAGNLFCIVFQDGRAFYKWRKKNIRIQESNPFNRRTYTSVKPMPDSATVQSEKDHMKLPIEQIPEVSDHEDSKSSRLDDLSALHDDSQVNIVVPQKTDFLKEYARTKLSVTHSAIEGQLNPFEEWLEVDENQQSISDFGSEDKVNALKNTFSTKEIKLSPFDVKNLFQTNRLSKNGNDQTISEAKDEDNDISARARELRQTQDLSNLSERSGLDRRESNSVFKQTGNMAVKTKQANNIFAMIAQKSQKHVHNEAAMQGKPYNINFQEEFDMNQPQSRIGSTIRDVPNVYKNDTLKNFNSAGNN